MRTVPRQTTPGFPAPIPIASLKTGGKNVSNPDRGPVPRKSDDAPGLLAPDAVPAGSLPAVLHRPRQRRLRIAANEQGRRHRPQDLRSRRRHLLHRLFHPGSAQQPGAGALRRPHLDRPHHDHLGPRLRRLRPDRRPDSLPGAALPAGRRRGRVLPRRDPLSHLLVPRSLPRQDRRHLHGGNPAGRPDRLPDLRRHPRHGRRPRPRRLAMDLHPRSRPDPAARHRTPMPGSPTGRSTHPGWRPNTRPG